MFNMITEQWQKMIDKGMIPIFEMDTKEGPMIVDLELVEEKGVRFVFDTKLRDTYFSGGITKFKFANHSFLLPFDEFNTDSLDDYLEKVYDEIVEGYLIPNNLI